MNHWIIFVNFDWFNHLALDPVINYINLGFSMFWIMCFLVGLVQPPTTWQFCEVVTSLGWWPFQCFGSYVPDGLVQPPTRWTSSMLPVWENPMCVAVEISQNCIAAYAGDLWCRVCRESSRCNERMAKTSVQAMQKKHDQLASATSKDEVQTRRSWLFCVFSLFWLLVISYNLIYLYNSYLW